MAAVWRDAIQASNQVIADPTQPYTFRWVPFLGAGESQAAVQIKSKPAKYQPTDTVSFMYDDPNSAVMWTLHVNTNTASTTWTIPANTFPAGKRMFAVRIQEGSTGTWTGWVIHKVDFDKFTNRQNHRNSATTGWNLPAGFVDGGRYAIKVETLSEAGISGESAEAQFDAWMTNKYILKGGVINAVPEYYQRGDLIGRVKR